MKKTKRLNLTKTTLMRCYLLPLVRLITPRSIKLEILKYPDKVSWIKAAKNLSNLKCDVCGKAAKNPVIFKSKKVNRSFEKRSVFCSKVCCGVENSSISFL